VRLIGEDGNVVSSGEIGELQIKGPSAAALYWNNREKSRHTFMGEWTRSGDKYIEIEDGYYQYCGRSDDMLKVSGIYVSPFEVEGALMTHPDILEAAVVAHADTDELIKPKAYVVLKPGIAASPELSSSRRSSSTSRKSSRRTSTHAGSNSSRNCRRRRPARSSASSCVDRTAEACLMRVLIIEDDLDIAGNLYEFLEGRGNVVDLARDGVTGLHLAVSGDFDAIVLDLGLPGVDGLCLCRKLRGEAKQDVPILILTARDLLDDKLAAFECGADDYLVKPFALREVEARLNALVVAAARPRGKPSDCSYEAIEYDRGQPGGDGGRTLGASFAQVPAPAGDC
jgi:CheY-like chemotaxis protein